MARKSHSLLQLLELGAVQGQSSTDRHSDWPSHLQPHVASNSSRYFVLSNSSFRFSSSVKPEGNNDVAALVLYAAFSVFGTTVNIFEISSLMIQENLRHHGNVFLANQALSNLLITTLGFPASCIAILSKTHRKPFVCYWQWYSALLSFFTSTLNYFFIALENLLRAYRKRYRSRRHDCYISCCSLQIVVFAVFFSWIASTVWVLIFIYDDQSPDLCTRQYGHSVNLYTCLIPVSLTILTFFLTVQRSKRHLRELRARQCLESREESFYRQLFQTNASSYLLFLCFWMPLMVAVSLSASERTGHVDVGNRSTSVQTLFVLAQASSCFCGLVYAFANSSFRQAFIYLTRYFCCKAHPEFTKSTFQEKPRGTVRVHIGMETRARTNRRMAIMMQDMPRRDGNHFL